MTALYMDGFDHYGLGGAGTACMLNGPWANVTDNVFVINPPIWGPARTGEACLSFDGAGSAIARKLLPDGAETNVFASVAFSLDQLPQGDWAQYIIDFRDGSNAVLYSVGIDSSGRIRLWNGAQNTLNAVTSGSVIVPQTWHFLEMEIDLISGTFVLRVDDPTGTNTPVLTASVATSGTILSVGFGQYNGSSLSSIKMHWDDLFLRNGDGTINNGWLGDRRISTLFPNADTADANWAPSYYKEFGPGILRLAYTVPNNNNPIGVPSYIVSASATSLNIGAADFTLETMVRFDKLPAPTSYSTIFNRWNTSGDNRSYRFFLGGSSMNGGCLQFDTTTDGTPGTLQTLVQYPWTPDTNQWYHVALVRASGELLLFVNGEQLGLPLTDSTTYFPSTSVFQIGAEQNIDASSLVGRVDETRFTNGVGRYTGPFSPPTAAFPTGVSDPDWASVVLLCTYDSGITDSSSYARSLSAVGAAQQTPNDGPDIGLYSTVNKATPDDHTFIGASFVSASNILTMTTQPSNGNTVTVGTTDGATPAVYKFVTVLVDPYDVLIDTTAQNTLINLYNAINAGAGIGTKYGTGTLANWDVAASQLPVGQIMVTAITAGVVGNSIPSTETGTAAAWASVTLTGGSDIPGPTSFKFQRPPSNTTIISAIQTVIRATKTDSGLGTVQTTFIGPLGGTEDGDPHALAISVNYYNDIIEVDPDTSGPLSPTTIIGGELQINRTE